MGCSKRLPVPCAKRVSVCNVCRGIWLRWRAMPRNSSRTEPKSQTFAVTSWRVVAGARSRNALNLSARSGYEKSSAFALRR